jgi:hypothetical protein
MQWLINGVDEMSRSVLALFLMCSVTKATITQAMLDKVIAIESSGRASAVGDKGAGLGLAQFHYAAWQDTSAWRAKQGLPVYPYHKALDAYIARDYLHSWLSINAARFKEATGRLATLVDLYAIHNLGFNGYKKRGFDIERCPAITLRKSKLLR